MYTKLLLLIVILYVAWSIPITHAQVSGALYHFDYSIGKLDVSVNKSDAGSVSARVFAQIRDRNIAATCIRIINDTYKPAKIVNFTKNEDAPYEPYCEEYDFGPTGDDTLDDNADIEEVHARAYCLVAFGEDAVPYLKYKTDISGNTELVSASCIQNTRKVGDADKSLERVCVKGVKEVSVNDNYKCRACIERYNQIELDSPGLGEQSIPGVQCTIPSGVISSPRPAPRPITSSQGKNNSITNNRESYNRVTPNNVGSRGGQQQYRPPVGMPRGQQPPASQPQRQSLWESIKQSLGGGGRSSQGRQGTRKILPECQVFLALDTDLQKGESTTLQWSLEYTSSAYITPGIGLVNPTEGSVNIRPRETTTYTMQLHNKNGYASCAPVTVSVVDDVEDDPTEDDTPKDPLIKCSPDNVRTGGTAKVLWQCPRGVSASSGSSTEYPNFSTGGVVGGSVDIYNIQEDGKFVVRCLSDTQEELGRNSCNIEVSDQITGTDPIDDGVPRLYIASDKTEVGRGEVVSISWRGVNTDNCMLTDGADIKVYGNAGSITGSVQDTSTLELICVADGIILPKKGLTITVD
jgi:hypothetical protein